MSGPEQVGELPARIGKYEVLSRLGSGGMAEVFLARQPGMAGFTKTVVVKRLKPTLAEDPRFVQLFIEEAKLAAQVQHKNVVQIFELGSEGAGAVFMAMEYVTGADLNSLLVHAGKIRRRFPPWLSVHAVCEVLEALAFAYALTDDEGRARHIVHNDVSPENIFFARHGEVKLADFGVAVDATRAADPFPEGLKGKLAYMSPERVAGQRPSPQSDVYAVGVVLWECLAQRRLFVGEQGQGLAKKVMKGVDIPPSYFVDDVPKALDALVMHTLSREPSERPKSAQALQEQLMQQLASLQPQPGLASVRQALESLLGPPQEPSSGAEPTTIPDTPVPVDLASQPDFQMLITDVVEDVVASTGSLPSLPAEMTASWGAGSWPDTPFIPPPPGSLDAHDDPEMTAIVRKRVRPRGATPVRREPSRAAPAPSGPRPSVWVRSRGGVHIGPRDPLEALGVLEELGNDDARRALEITVDQQSWLPVLDLPRLLGEAHIGSDPTLPPAKVQGSFQNESPTSILAKVSRSGVSGRLIFIRYETTAAERVEFYVEMGHLVGFGASRHLLPGWSFMLETPDEVEPDVVHALGEVIRTQRKLTAVAQVATQRHLLEARGLALTRKLVEVHTWPWARYAFEPGALPVAGRVTPQSIFGCLAEVLEQAKPVPVLMAHLSADMDAAMVRSASFEREVHELALDIDDQARLDRFGFARTLRDSFAASTSLRDERPSVRLGYLLKEMGVLIRQDADAG